MLSPSLIVDGETLSCIGRALGKIFTGIGGVEVQALGSGTSAYSATHCRSPSFDANVTFCDPCPATMRPRSMRQKIVPDVDGFESVASYDWPGQIWDGALIVG